MSKFLLKFIIVFSLLILFPHRAAIALDGNINISRVFGDCQILVHSNGGTSSAYGYVQRSGAYQYFGGSAWIGGVTVGLTAIDVNFLSGCVSGSLSSEFSISESDGASGINVSSDSRIALTFSFRGISYTYSLSGTSGTVASVEDNKTDFIRPNIVLGTLTATGSGTYSSVITLSEAPSGNLLELSDLIVGNGTATLSGSGTSYTAIISPTDNFSGVVTLDVYADAFTDAEGNGNTAASQVSINHKIEESDDSSSEKAEAVKSARQIIESVAQSSMRLTLQNQPAVRRRIDRLENRSRNSGSIGIYGNNYFVPDLPLDAHLSSTRAQFAYYFSRLDQDQHMDIWADHALNDDDRVPHQAPQFEAWLEGTLGRQSLSNSNTQFTVIQSGVDFLATPKFLLGFGTQIDWIDYDAKLTSVNPNGYAENFGFMIGPYFTTKLHDKLYLDARASIGRAFTDLSPNGSFVDNITSDRFLFTSALAGNFKLSSFIIQPELRINYYRHATNSYSDSLGSNIVDNILESGVLEFGSNIRNNIDFPNGVTLNTSLSVDGVWTFADQKVGAVTSKNGKGVHARFEAGIDVSTSNGLSLSLSGLYDGVGQSNYEAYGVELRLSQRW